MQDLTMESVETASVARGQRFIKHLGERRPEIELLRAILLCIESFERFRSQSPALVADWVAVSGSVGRVRSTCRR
jgi:hypothetical protein